MLFLAASAILSGVPFLPPEVDFNQQLGSVVKDFQEDVRGIVQRDCAKYDVVGATVAVVANGSLVAAVGVGKRRAGSPDPILVTDPMHVGSDTKAMTSLVFARLVEKGKIKFTDPVKKCFSFTPSDDFADVPMIEFMYQRSGIDNESAPKLQLPKYLPGPNDDFYHGPAELYEPKRHLYAEDCLTGKAAFPPGSKYSYCNANYVIVGAAEEEATGKVWEDLMEEQVFKPLHMKAAGFSAMGTGQDTETPWQHTKEDGAWKPIFHDNPRFMGPAGLVHCSALDLANFAYAQVLGAYGTGDYLHPQTWKILQTPPKGSSYACGLLTGAADQNGVRDMSHAGSNTLSFCEWRAVDHGQIVVVVMLNCASQEANDLIMKDVIALTRSKVDVPSSTR